MRRLDAAAFPTQRANASKPRVGGDARFCHSARWTLGDGGMVEFSNREDVEAWLRGQPKEVAVTLAARASARALPGLAIWNVDGARSDEVRAFVGLTLKTFRATALARVAAYSPTRASEAQFRAAAVAAADAADAAADAAAAFASYAAARAAAFADAASYAADAAAASYAADAAAYAADAAAYAADASYAAARAAASYAASFAAAARAAASYAASFAAAARAAAHAVFADDALERNPGAAALWPAGGPARVSLPGLGRSLPGLFADLWSDLKARLLARNGENWSVWTDWYDAWLEGREQFPQLSPEAREDLDVAICLIPNAKWDKGPAHVNAIIRGMIDAALAKAEPLEPIPKQGPGPHFGLGGDDRIELAHPQEFDADGNNVARIQRLLPLVLEAVADLQPSLAGNCYPALAKTVSRYSHALAAGDIAEIQWGVVWGLGVRVVNAADAVERDIAERMLPAMEDEGKEALTSLRDLHQPLILATREGRELQEESDRAQMTRDEMRRQKHAAQAFARSLNNASTIVDEAASETVSDAAESIGEGRHPERGSVYGSSTVKNAAITLVTVATAGATLHAAGQLAPVPEWAPTLKVSLGFFEWEVLKKAPQIADTFDKAGKGVGRLWDNLDNRARDACADFIQRTAPFRAYVVTHEALLRELAMSSPKLGWMTRYIDFIVQSEKRSSS